MTVQTNTLRSWRVFLAYGPPSLIPNHLHLCPLQQPCIYPHKSVHFQQQVQSTVGFFQFFFSQGLRKKMPTSLDAVKKCILKENTTLWKGLCTRWYLTSEWENTVLVEYSLWSQQRKILPVNVFNASLDIFLFRTYICRKLFN